ncbi:MAG: S-layer homology domain-containing protein [Eubacteriales bacterium]|nr:S-layer homology domain-containing protein [Eubacteriales bacterium]
MKKRLLSGLLAALMLFSAAFAADGDTAPAEGAEETVLTFAATLPEEMDTDQMWDKTQADVKAVLEKRLELLGFESAVVAFPDDRKTVAVTLPEGADAADGLATFLMLPNVLSIATADGKISLKNADVTLAEAGLDDGAAYIQLGLTDGAQKALAERDGDAALSAALDGAAVGEAAAYDAGALIVTGGFDLDAAKLYVARIMAGALPVTLTLVTDTGEDQTGQPAEPAFPDMAGHWAEASLARAVELGLLKGAGGKILPDDPVKRSEAAVILNRTLGASEADDVSGLKNVPQNAWYANDLGKAIHLGLIDAADSRNFDAACTRAEAFVLLARAFVYDGVPGDSDALAAFTDTSSMTAAQKNAAAALVSAGVVKGDTATTLAPNAALTRAQFVTMLLRIVPDFIEAEGYPETVQGGALLSAPENKLEDLTAAGDLYFPAAVEKIALDAVTAAGRVVLKGAEAVELTAQGKTELGLIAADPAGEAKIELTGGSSAGTLLIAGTGGAVSYRGAANNIEITASNRTITLTGMEAERLSVTGSGNTIVVDGPAAGVQIAGGAKNNHLTLNKAVDTLTVAGLGSKVDGRGKAGEVDIRAVGCEVTLTADSKLENIDQGLAGVSIEIGVPTKVTPGGSLLTQVKFAGVQEPKVCKAQWYQDGKPIEGFANENFELTADKVSRHTSYFEFTKNMQKSVTIGFKLSYANPSTGETEEVYAEKTVPIENHSDEWYYQRDVDRVLGLVSSTYRGNYTTAYAVNNDYASYEKEVFVNAKGYSSNSKYLLWINRAYQHVNVFTGSKGNWKLHKSFLVGTGAASTPTPTGITTVSYKSAGGWTTSTYTVRPVVGFYPGTGYAFHSRLCYPGTDKEYDFSAGYPVSHGCVRMYKSDIQWIYDTVPVGTTVVIF